MTKRYRDEAPEIAQFLCEGDTLFANHEHLVRELREYWPGVTGDEIRRAISIAEELGARLYYDKRRHVGYDP